MPWSLEQFVRCPFLNYPAKIHHRHSVADMSNDSKIMCNEDKCNAQIALELAK
jgi:hypothetical protein